MLGRRRFTSDLIPSRLIVARYFAAEQAEIDAFDVRIAELEQDLAEKLEEGAGEDGLLAEVIEGEGDKQKITAKALKARLKEIGRVEYVPVMDDEALEAFQMLTRVEGIIPALEPSHALAHVAKLAPTMDKDQIIVMNLCGRGDKDVFAVGQMLGFDM